MVKNYQPLWDAYKYDCRGEPIVLIHPDERRPYTVDELINVRRRPFALRWYITGLNVQRTTVWLRTHFTDHADCESPTRRLRDLVRATISTDNEVAAKSNLADLLTQWFEMEQTEYYSLACMMGSALCDHGHGIKFETQVDKEDETFILESKDDEELARLRFTRLMHILFSKISSERFLVKDGGSNIFRLAYCLSQILDYKNNGDNFLTVLVKSYGAAFTAIFSQVTLTVYVILAVSDKAKKALNGDEEFANLTMLPLALLTLFLSGVFILPSIRNSAEITEFYYQEKRGMNAIALMDYLSNLVLPLVLAVFGFLVILIQGEGAFIEAVLNSTALLFILDIDDILPDVINVDPTYVVRNHLITAALNELEEMRETLERDTINTQASTREKAVSAKERLLKKQVNSIQFSDLLLTNFACGGSDVKDSRTFAPYEVKGSRSLPNVSNSNYITTDCLLRRVEWTYSKGDPLSTNPRIGLLRMWKLGDDDKAEPYVVCEIGTRATDYTFSSIKKIVPIEPHAHIMIHNANSKSTKFHSDRIHQINDEYDDEELLSSDRKLQDKRDAELDELNETYSIDGVYMITCFEMSDAIVRLRICGSNDASNFASAMQYYSLWDCGHGASKMLNKVSESVTKPDPAKEEAASKETSGGAAKGFDQAKNSIPA